MFGTYSTKSPPNRLPGIEPTPPTTRPTRNDDREQEIEAVGRDELDHDGAERAGDAGIEGADPEGQGLVERGVDAHRRRRDRMVADRHHRAAAAAVDEVDGGDEQHQHHRQREVIEPLVGVERQPERRIRLQR